MKKAIVTYLFFLLLFNGNSINAKTDISDRIEMMPWTEVNKFIPRYAEFTVLDLETGKKFKVQRRAGRHHADVQPITAADTKVMKKIYGGKWSWKRRAIIVISKGHWIAASMHGMPHGAGALKNNFPGHFCIHFYGSTTHRTNKMDFSHMLMVFKASGKLDDYLAKAGPYEVAKAYIAGIKQQDRLILSLVSLQKIKWGPIFSKIENVKMAQTNGSPLEERENELNFHIPVKVDWYIQSEGKKTFKGEIHLVRFAPFEPWRVDSVSFLNENELPKEMNTFMKKAS